MPPRKRERAGSSAGARSEQSQGRASGSRSKGGPGKACAASAASASLSATAAQEESDDDAAAATARPQETGTALSCVLKVYCTSVRPNFAQPWQMKRQQESTSSGFILRDEQIFPARGIIILTNAHSVAHSVTVRVRKHGSPVKHVAKVLHIGHECDVAVLVVEDPAFYDDLPEPLQLGHTARLQDPVTVVGYPTGGDNLSVTVGVVSRVDVQAYSHSSERFLTLQIDAAINAGVPVLSPRRSSEIPSRGARRPEMAREVACPSCPARTAALSRARRPRRQLGRARTQGGALRRDRV